MTILFIVIALFFIFICVASILFFPPKESDDYTEFLPPSGVLKKVSLLNKYKRVNTYTQCYVVKIRLNRIIKFLKRNVKLLDKSAVLSEVHNNEYKLRAVSDRARAHLCHGINYCKYSEVFAVCKLLVNSERGIVPQNLLKRAVDLLAARNEPSQRVEEKTVLYINDLCLLNFLLDEVENEIRDVKEFCRAENDCKIGRIDISCIQTSAYVAGLFGCRDNAEYYLNLFDYNEIDINGLLNEYARVCAERAGVLAAVFDCFSTGISVNVSGDDGRVFGDETSYNAGLLSGDDVFVKTDNRGAINALYCGSDYPIVCGVEADGKYIGLTAFDGIFQRHRAVYRTKKGTEICAQFVCSQKMPCVLCRFSAVGSKALVRIRMRFALPYDAQTERYDNGIVCYNGDNAVGVTSCSASGKYEGVSETGEICREIFFDGSIESAEFEKRECIVAVCFAHDKSSVNGMFEVISEQYFDYAETAAKIHSRIADAPSYMYSALCGNYKFDNVIAHANAPVLVFGNEDMQKPLKLRYALYELNNMGKRFTAIAVVSKSLFGLASSIGLLPVDCESDRAKRALTIAANLRKNETSVDYQALFMCKPDNSVCCERCDFSFVEDKYSVTVNCDKVDLPLIAVLINGKIVTPFIENARIKVMLGYTEYSSRFNGNVFTLKAYECEFEKVTVYDLRIDGAAFCPQVLFAVSDGVAPMRVEKTEKCICAIGALNNSAGFYIGCSERIDDYTPYEEGYCGHGLLEFDGTFRRGGCTLSPAISAKAMDGRIVFFMGSVADLQCKYDFSTQFADEYLSRKTAVFDCAVSPLTSYEILNRCYMQSLNRINESFVRGKGVPECFVQLYYAPEAVREHIFRCCKIQSGDGRINNFYDTLIFPLLVERYVKRIGDEGFFCEKCECADGEILSVLEHCMRAMYYASDHNDDNVSAAVLYVCIKRYINIIPRSRREKLSGIAHNIKREADESIQSIDIRAIGCNIETHIMNGLCVLSERSARAVLSLVGDYLNGDCVGKLDVGFSLLYACALYRTFDGKRAYDVLRNVTESLMAGDVPNILNCPIETVALYYMIVTEQLFGIAIGKHTKLSPNIAENTPHIEYRLKNGAPIRVIVDDGNKSGSWKLRMGNVVCSSNTVGNIKEGVVTVFKNGA